MTLRARAIVATLAATLAVVAGPAQAQSSLSVVAGANRASLTFDPPIRDVYAEAFGFDAASSGVNTLAAGMFFERLFGGRPGVRIEGLFSQAGTRIEGSANNVPLPSTARATSFGINGADYAFEEKIRLSMLEVPVMVVFPLGIDHKVRLMGGGFVAHHLSQTERFRETVGGESRNINLDRDHQAQMKSTHFGIALGAEINLTRRVGVGGRFNLGLTNIDDEDDFDSIKMRILRVYVVIRVK